MPRSKEKYPEKNGDKWSYCYQGNPEYCNTHFHVTSQQLAKLLDARKKTIEGETVEYETVEDLMNNVFVEETEQEYAARTFKYPNNIEENEDGTMVMAVFSPDLSGLVKEEHRQLSTGTRNVKTGETTWNKKIVFEARVRNDKPQEGDSFDGEIKKEFDNYREAAEWVNDQVQYFQSVKEIYGKVIDIACKEPGCNYRSGGPSHFNYKESGKFCQYASNPKPHCTCRACWG